ncbi:MAG: hypothetical protein Q9209_007793 [Squamulea sp. 1 TL-2023]
MSSSRRDLCNTSVERVGPGPPEHGNKEVAGCVALHRQYLEPNGTAPRTDICASAGTPEYEGAKGSWDGVGILKTVSLDTWTAPASDPDATLSRPSKAVLHTSFPNNTSIG